MHMQIIHPISIFFMNKPADDNANKSTKSGKINYIQKIL